MQMACWPEQASFRRGPTIPEQRRLESRSVVVQGLCVRATLRHGTCATSLGSTHLKELGPPVRRPWAHPLPISISIPVTRCIYPGSLYKPASAVPAGFHTCGFRMLLQAVNGASERLSLFEGGVSDEEGFAFVDVKWSEGEGFDTTMISALADMGPAANVTAAIRRPVTTIDATVRAVDEVFFMKVVNLQHAACGMQPERATCKDTPCDRLFVL